MAIQFDCDRCGKHFNADESLAGKRFRCKQCGNTSLIPGPSRPKQEDRPSPAALEPEVPTVVPSTSLDPYALEDVPETSPRFRPEETFVEQFATVAPKKVRSRGNPWKTMWLRPRDTIRRIEVDDRGRDVLLLIAFNSLCHALMNSFRYEQLTEIHIISLLLSLGITAALEFLFFYFIFAQVVSKACHFLGGSGETAEVRVALAWSSVPLVAVTALWGLLFLLTGQSIIRRSPAEFANPTGAQSLIALAVTVLYPWHLVLLVKGLGEAMGLSSWRALGSLVLTYLFFVVAVFVLVMAFVLTFRPG